MSDSDDIELSAKENYAVNGQSGAFGTTHWSIVLQAGSENPTLVRAALEKTLPYLLL